VQGALEAERAPALRRWEHAIIEPPSDNPAA
jgi:hypothetical protein